MSGSPSKVVRGGTADDGLRSVTGRVRSPFGVVWSMLRLMAFILLWAGVTGSASAASPIQAFHLPPALQALIAPPVAPHAASAAAGASGASAASDTSSGSGGIAATASGPSGTDGAAGASSGPRDAAMVESLDHVIDTLENDKARSDLLRQLKQLRDATRETPGAIAAASAAASAAAPLSASSTAEATVRAVQAGLLGAIGAALGAVTQQAGDDAPLRYWVGRFNAAGNELNTIASGVGSYSTGRAVLDLAMMLAIWGGSAVLLILIQHRIYRRFNIEFALHANPTTMELLVFLARRVGPWIIAFLIALYLSKTMALSFGRTVAMVLAYAVVAGAVFSAICLMMFSLFGAGHRRAAVHLLIARSRRLLFAIGLCGALGDAMRNYDVSMMLGSNLAGLVATAANLTAAVLTGYFALAFRRPVAHLFINRSHDQRFRQKALTEIFEVLGSLWHIPVLLLAVVAVTATLAGLDSSTDALQRAIVTALLMVVAFFITALVHRVTRAPQDGPSGMGVPPRRRNSGYIGRFVRFFGTLLVFFVWCAFLELVARFWGHSLLGALSTSPAAQRVGHAIAGTGVTLLSAWLLWLVVDTAIVETLNPSNHRGKARSQPSTRARTILPLLRNVLLGALLLVVAISTLANMGLNVTPLLAGAGVIGLAIGFGAQSLVQDVITGLFILIEDTISIGDSVEVDGGHAGVVENLTVRTVRLRDGQGAIHSVPFSQIKTVKNLSRDFAYTVFEVRIAFSTDVDLVTRMIRDVGDEMLADVRYRANILGPIEVWGLDRFEPNWMILKGQIKTRPLQQSGIGRAFNLLLKQRMDQAGIPMPTPQTVMVLPPPLKPAETVIEQSTASPS